MVNENDITKEHYDAALTRHGCKNKLNGSVVYIGHGIEVWQRIAPAHQPNYRRSHLAHILECKEEVDLAWEAGDEVWRRVEEKYFTEAEKHYGPTDKERRIAEHQASLRRAGVLLDLPSLR